MAKSKYTKLCGHSLLSVQSCYMGEDHLLILNGRYKERVKRLQYADIEATLVCPTKTWHVVALISALFAFFFLMVALSHLGEPSFAWWIGLVCGLLLIFAYGLYVKGSAVVGVQTAVQTVVFEGVSTLRKARKVEAKLARRIEAEQGHLSTEALRAALLAKREARRRARNTPRNMGTPPPLRTGVVAPDDRSATA